MHGIQDPLDEVIPSYALPRMVETILLPFKGKIIYDGLLAGYNIHFGAGIRSNLNRAYAVAKQKNRIITTLELEFAPPTIIKPGKNITPQLNELSVVLSKLKGNNTLQSSALALARASIEIAAADHQGNLPPDNANKEAHKILKTSKRLLNQLDIMEEE